MWSDLAAEMAKMLSTPAKVTLIVTDRFVDTVRGLEGEVPETLGGTQNYDPTKPDGSLAVARTLPLHDRTVVVVNAGLVAMGRAAIRRVLHHEAQHVRLHQADDIAWAMHRRAPFERPIGFGYAHVYLAQSMIDEYRCEAAVASAVARAATELDETPNGYPAIASLFCAIRTQFVKSGDLEAAYESSLIALNRLGPYLAYATATIARGELRADEWLAVEPVRIVAETLLTIPPASTPRGYAELQGDVTDAVHALDAISNHLGFKVGVDEDADQAFLYFY